jgi:Domain of unknown function (DUF4625)
MMMRNVAVLTACVVLMFSCRRDTKIDVLPPEINKLTVNGLDTAIVEVMAGDTLDIEVALSDNDALDEMRVVIHPSENGHAHAGSGYAGGEYRLNSGKWIKEEVVQLSRTQSANSERVQAIAPDTIAGNWHLVVTAIDRVGNVSVEYAALIKVTNDDLPVIEATTSPAPSSDGIVYMSSGNTLTLEGIVSDPDGVQSIRAYTIINGLMGQVTNIAMAGTPLIQTFQGATFDDADAGTYRVVIEAIDTEGNLRLWDRRVVVQ